MGLAILKTSELKRLLYRVSRKRTVEPLTAKQWAEVMLADLVEGLGVAKDEKLGDVVDRIRRVASNGAKKGWMAETVEYPLPPLSRRRRHP